MASPLLGFVVLEFTHALGPHAGQYPVAPREHVEADQATGATLGEHAADVLIFAVRDAPGDGVRLAVATYVWATAPLASEAEADAWITTAEDDPALVDHAVRAINTAIRAHRVDALDPYASEITRADARSVRAGAATGQQLRVDESTLVRDLAIPPPSGEHRRSVLRPSETVASVLGGRVALLDGEEHLLRALLDLDQGRVVLARNEARCAAALLADELDSDAARTALAQAQRLAPEDEAVLELVRLLVGIDGVVARRTYRSLTRRYGQRRLLLALVLLAATVVTVAYLVLARA